VTPAPREQRIDIWTGEPTITLPVNHGHGGRAQHLALLVALALTMLERSGVRVLGIQVLVAGTDGRDGPTDAAGAIVDCNTVTRMAAAGIDVGAAIARRDAYPALDAVGALVRLGQTGTNVADMVMVSGYRWY
jgi:hydroxypyruvate reductase